MSSIFRTLLLASCVTAWAAGEAAAAEYQCRKLDSSLRIAVEVKKAGHTLPCDVIAEDDRGERALLYSAQFDRAYCPSRIERTRSELEQDGWTCEKTSDQNVVRDANAPAAIPQQQAEAREESPSDSVSDEPLADGGRVVLSTRQCRQGDNVRSINVEVENPNTGRPCELIYWSDGDQTKEGQLLWRAEHDATFCPRRLETIVEKWVSEGWNCGAEEPQTAAVEPAAVPVARSIAPESQAEVEDEVAASPSPAADTSLEAVVTADAERISEWMEVEPDIEIAARGDLNDDGSDDAVVFLAYQSDQAAYRQYLMSYLVADGSYELASVKLLTDVGPPPAQARVEEIDKGVIWLTLPDADGSASEKTGYRLRDEQLVEVDARAASSDGDN
ncbi:MAG: hypothetical protein AAGA21_09625 [Pseudomonadota bacterium]